MEFDFSANVFVGQPVRKVYTPFYRPIFRNVKSGVWDWEFAPSLKLGADQKIGDSEGGGLIKLD